MVCAHELLLKFKSRDLLSREFDIKLGRINQKHDSQAVCERGEITWSSDWPRWPARRGRAVCPSSPVPSTTCRRHTIFRGPNRTRSSGCASRRVCRRPPSKSGSSASNGCRAPLYPTFEIDNLDWIPKIITIFLLATGRLFNIYSTFIRHYIHWREK